MYYVIGGSSNSLIMKDNKNTALRKKTIVSLKTWTTKKWKHYWWTELEGLHNVSCNTTRKKSSGTVLGYCSLIKGRKEKKIPNPQTQMVSQERGILVKGNEDTPRRYHSTWIISQDPVQKLFSFFDSESEPIEFYGFLLKAM